jgi:uncharacterized protein
MLQIQRSIKQNVINCLNQRQIAIIYGTRQVGKTTLTKQIVEYYKIDLNYSDGDILQLDGDLLSTQRLLSTQELQPLQNLVGKSKLLIIDEAQRIPNIGINTKILHDNIPELQIILTGSSSFDLANIVNEPLTGRSIEFLLTPFCYKELLQIKRPFEIQTNINDILIYGTYPMVNNSSSYKDKIIILNGLVSNYLYKDILVWDKIKKSNMLVKLLQLLALQIGGTVSYHKLATILEINTETVAKYINLLEKCFVIFRLRAFSRNHSDELKNSFKVYFWDLGVRNSLINNFNSLEFRQDVGMLWENYCVMERYKKNLNSQNFCNTFFWRNYAQNEVDYIEDQNGKLSGYEFKYSKDKVTKGSYNFIKNYENTTLELINKDNFVTFLD